MHFAGSQEHCSTDKGKDNEEMWKMGKSGNSAEVNLLGSSFSKSTATTTTKPFSPK
jgi:hypothetical protein